MQQAKLKELKQNDIQEMKMIAEKFGNNGEIFEVFENIIERRYEKLNKFFEDHIESMKLSISTPEMTLKKESPDLDSIFNAINSKDLKQTSGQLWDDIEKIWQQIENFEENSSFLQDPQPLPPLTPIYQGKNEFGKIVSFNEEYDHENSVKTVSFLDFPSTYFALNKPLHKFEENEYLKLTENSDEPLKAQIKNTQNINILLSSLTMTLEHSEALKDYSSISSTPVTEQKVDFSSLEIDLSLKFKNFPECYTGNQQIFNDNSLSNPFTLTIEKPSPDNSGEELVTERAISVLVHIIYNDILDSNSEIFEDIEFVYNLTEYLLEKYLILFINEELKPRPILNSDNPKIPINGSSLLSFIDVLFLSALKSPENFKNKIYEVLNPLALLDKIQNNQKFFYDRQLLFESIPDDSPNQYVQIHNIMLTQACSEAALLQFFVNNDDIFEFRLERLDHISLSNLFLSARESMYKWNEIKTGTIPFRETISSDGRLDEEKLLFLRNKSLASLLYLELEESEKSWSNYRFEHAQIVIELENLIFDQIVTETLSFLSE